MYPLDYLHNLYSDPPWYGPPLVPILSYFAVFFSGWKLAKISFEWQVKREDEKAADDLQKRKRALKAELDHLKRVIGEIREQIIDKQSFCIKRLNQDFVAECRLRGFNNERSDFRYA